jgi:very-short-patch-repair endonuclease
MDAKGRTHGVDHEIGELAGRQHGVIARRQLLALGVSRTGIGGRCRRGSLHPLHRGVYAVGHRKLSVLARWMAAVLACGPEAVLSHRSAGQLWGLLPRTGSIPETTRPTAFRARAGIRIHQSALPADEVEKVDGIPATSVSRTLLDLAGTLDRRPLERAMAEAEARGLTSALSLPELLERYPRRPGTPALRPLLAEGESGVTRSELEERFLALIARHRLPRPLLNVDLAVRGRFFEVDCLWRRARLVVELDGHAVHGTRKAFAADRERDRLLLGDGWGVVRLTWGQVRDEGPRIAAELRALLQKRSSPAHKRGAPTL